MVKDQFPTHQITPNPQQGLAITYWRDQIRLRDLEQHRQQLIRKINGRLRQSDVE